jgi:hypothetical protein
MGLVGIGVDRGSPDKFVRPAIDGGRAELDKAAAVSGPTTLETHTKGHVVPPVKELLYGHLVAVVRSAPVLTEAAYPRTALKEAHPELPYSIVRERIDDCVVVGAVEAVERPSIRQGVADSSASVEYPGPLLSAAQRARASQPSRRPD